MIKHPLKKKSRDRFIFLGVILEVWFCILDFWAWIWRFGPKNMGKKEEQIKKEGKVDCLQGANPVLPQGERAP